MNIEATKLELMQMLLETQKESLLLKLRKVFEEEQIDWWDEISDEEKSEIKTGLSEAENAEIVENSVVMKHFEKWH